MSQQAEDRSGDTLTGPLNEAAAFVRAQPAPREVMRRTVETAAGWADAPPPGAFPHRWLRITAVVAAVAATLVITVVGVLTALDHRPPIVAGGNPTPPAVPDSSVAAFYMPMPVTHPVVAEAAPVFVTIGPEQPTRLGARVEHDDIRVDTDHTKARIHVWDWSRSPLSRVMWATGSWQRLAPAALSPDGTLLLNSDGNAIELASGDARRYAGFETAKGRRVERLRFSPDGKHIAALISASGKGNRVHAWSIRVVELATGRTLSEFPADDVDWFAWVAFTPDGASVVYADPANVVTRRDLRTGAVLARYEPALEPHGVVGVAVSPRSRYIAAGHYHGNLFVWNSATGKSVLRQPFRRPNGGADTFWKAKVLAFSRDGEMLATSSSARLQVLEVRTGRLIARVDAPLPSHVSHLRWSADGRTITLVVASSVVTDSSDRSWPPRATADVLPRVYQWDLQSGNAPAELSFEVGAAATVPE